MGKRGTFKRFGIDFDGFEQLFDQLKALDGDMKKVTEDCLDFIPGMVNPNLKADMARHKKYSRGRHTVDTIVEGERVQWEGTEASIKVGFDIKRGGLASIFLMYGTARHAPHPGTAQDKKLYDDVFGYDLQKRIADRQREIFSQAIRRRMGSGG